MRMGSRDDSADVSGPRSGTSRFFCLSLLDLFFDRFGVKLNVRVFDKVEVAFVEGNNQAVNHRRIAVNVRKPGVNLLYRNKATLPARFDDRLQSRIQTIHAIPLCSSEPQ
jgi:hypothetical protein